MNPRLPILVIRTVSVEKLSPVLDDCAKMWPKQPLIVVSSPTRGNELITDPRILEIIPHHTGAEGFSNSIACNRALAALVLPIANTGGSGYANVMRACHDLPASERYFASPSQGLRKKGRLAWQWRWRLELGLQFPARWIGRLWGAWIARNLSSF